jgi:hypothetical protein
MVAHALFQRLANPQAVPAAVSLKALVDFWLPREMVAAVGAHPAHQVYQCLRQDGKEVRAARREEGGAGTIHQEMTNEAPAATTSSHSSFSLSPPHPSPLFPSSRPFSQYLVHDDFRPLVECVLQYHPGLEFLKDTAEFQKKYLETVIYRIFYTLNRWVGGEDSTR